MSVDINIYVGFYVKAKCPARPTKVERYICPKCNTEINTAFCPECGTKGETITTEEDLDSMYDVLDELGIDGDFNMPDIDTDEDGYETILYNGDSDSNTCIDMDEMNEYEIPSKTPDDGWTTLFEHFKEQKIKYKKCFGVVVYYS